MFCPFRDSQRPIILFCEVICHASHKAHASHFNKGKNRDWSYDPGLRFFSTSSKGKADMTKMANQSKNPPVGYIYSKRQVIPSTNRRRSAENPPFLLLCTCNPEIQKELNILKENSNNALNQSWEEINMLETDLSKYLEEISELEKELQGAVEEEHESLALLEKLECGTERHESLQQAIDSQIRGDSSDAMLDPEDLQCKDEKIRQMEKKLMENTKLIQKMRRSMGPY